VHELHVLQCKYPMNAKSLIALSLQLIGIFYLLKSFNDNLPYLYFRSEEYSGWNIVIYVMFGLWVLGIILSSILIFGASYIASILCSRTGCNSNNKIQFTNISGILVIRLFCAFQLVRLAYMASSDISWFITGYHFAPQRVPILLIYYAATIGFFAYVIARPDLILRLRFSKDSDAEQSAS